MEEAHKFQIVYVGPTNLCQHSTTDLMCGIMTNKYKQSVLLKVRSFKHSKTTSSFFCPTQGSLAFSRGNLRDKFRSGCGNPV